jgi:transposase-like protein
LREKVKADFHEIVYAENEAAARQTQAAVHGQMETALPRRGEEPRRGRRRALYDVPLAEAALEEHPHHTNVIERLNGEVRRRVKTQGSLPSEAAVPTELVPASCADERAAAYPRRRPSPRLRASSLDQPCI